MGLWCERCHQGTWENRNRCQSPLKAVLTGAAGVARFLLPLEPSVRDPPVRHFLLSAGPFLRKLCFSFSLFTQNALSLSNYIRFLPTVAYNNRYAFDLRVLKTRLLESPV